MSIEARESLLKKAEQIANVIFRRLELRRRKSSTLKPKVYEIILYGSVATGGKKPSDIDLIIFDNGYFSDFSLKDSDYLSPGFNETYSSREYALHDISRLLLKRWFRANKRYFLRLVGGSDSEVDIVNLPLRDTNLDLFVLPLRFLKSREFRTQQQQKHKDPKLFKNIFKKALRFNRRKKQFEPLTLEYLEKRYDCCLSDLR